MIHLFQLAMVQMVSQHLPTFSSVLQHIPASLSMNWKGIDALWRAGMSVPVCVRRCFVLCSKSSSFFCCVHGMALHPATALFYFVSSAFADFIREGRVKC